MPTKRVDRYFKLRQLHLHLALMALRAQRKDIQDQHGAVNDTCLYLGRQIAHLRGRQVMIEDDQRCFQLFDHRGDLVHLAASCKSGGIGSLTLAFHQSKNAHSGTFSQQALILLGFLRNPVRQNQD